MKPLHFAIVYRGFADFCQSDNDRPLWDSPVHSAGLTVTVVTAPVVLCFPLYDCLLYTPLPRIAAAILAPLTAVGFTVGARMTLLWRLRSAWAVQKELVTVTGREKTHHPVSRVLYALVFFLSLGLAVWVGIAVFAPQIIKIAGLIPELPLWMLGAVLILPLTGWVAGFTARALARRRFLARLKQLSQEGRITYSVEGHPYLSLLSSRLYAGLLVTHRAKVGNLRQQTVYRVGLVNGKSRRSILILCQNQVYRFLHRLPGQYLARRMGARGWTFYTVLRNFLWLGIVCWWVQCACEFSLYMILYRDVAPQNRDYTCLCWTQHIVFFIAYHILFTKRAHKEQITPEPRLNPLRTLGDFLRRNRWQILFMLLIAVLFEVAQAVTGGSPNTVSTCLALFIPSAVAIEAPIVRTLVGLSISLDSMLVSHVLCRYQKSPSQNG